MITKQDLLDQRELIQNDIQCGLDDMPEELVEKVCQCVVDHFDVLLKLTEPILDDGRIP